MSPDVHDSLRKTDRETLRINYVSSPSLVAQDAAYSRKGKHRLRAYFNSLVPFVKEKNEWNTL